MKTISFILIVVVCGEILAEADDVHPKWIFLDFYCIRRPTWFKKITDLFQKTHFGESDSANGLNLNHVISWNSIRKQVSKRIKVIYEAAMMEYDDANGYESLYNFVDDLFTPDNNAIVNNVFDNVDLALWPKPGRRHHFFDYLSEELRALNNNYHNDVLMIIEALRGDVWTHGRFHQEINAPRATYVEYHEETKKLIADMMLLLFNAPANLRYGQANTNSGIGDKLDPMGDEQGNPTFKELMWYKEYKEEFDFSIYEDLITSSTGHIKSLVDPIRYFINKKL